jgi:SMC interacting uncharacterized protein involved in chromosome segregation
VSGDEQSYDYEQLSPEQRAEIIDRRLAQYEAEHFEHSLNRKALASATDLDEGDKQRQLQQIDLVLENLARSIELHRAERAQLVDGS